MMSRLADYFFIVGVEDTSELANGKELKGTVVQKFPDQDWKDAPSPQGLEVFCQPTGWQVSSKPKEPTFQVTILTDVSGKRSYLACLCYFEQVSQKRDSHVLNIELNENANLEDVKEAITASEYAVEEFYYVPRCLCVVSRNRYYQTLKNCLITIFNAYLNNQTELLEKMIGCMIGFVHVPPPGGPKLTFSIGGSDNQVIHPQLTANLPATQDSIAIIFHQLGIHSMLQVFTALVTECKIVLLSSSYSHLIMAAEALISLLYPQTFNHVFIPVLPAALLDFVSAPTPFLMGVHTSYGEYLPELFDVVHVNIDEGYVTVPDSINLSVIPEPYYTQILKTLKMILTPSLYTLDILLPVSDPAPSLVLQDKQLRAVFIKFFAEITAGYRACLTLIRVHPEPIISFNKLAFMEKRGFLGDDFISKVLDSFSTMLQARGPPYRVIDMFDRLVVEFLPSKEKEEKSIQQLLSELISIVDELMTNEVSLESPDENKIPNISPELLMKPMKGFPLLSETKINSYITKNENSTQQAKAFQAPVEEPTQVPMSSYDKPTTHFINQRRLEVIKDCIQYIYDNKISEARKAIPSVKRALTSKGAQLALCNELEIRVRNDNSLLEHDQYNLLVYLINSALQDDNTVNSTNVAARIVPLVAAFHRKLGPSVIQFAYTSVQDHSIWSNSQFWEEAFYNEAQRRLIELYAKDIKSNERLNELTEESSERRDTLTVDNVDNGTVHQPKDTEEKIPSAKPSPSCVKRSLSENESVKLLAERTTAALGRVDSSPSHHRSSMLISPSSSIPRSRAGTTKSSGSIQLGDVPQSVKKNALRDMPSAMKLAADLMGEWDKKTEEEKGQLIYEEESIIFSLTKLFVQHMMYLRVPTNACVEMRKRQQRRRELERKRKEEAGGGGANELQIDDTASIARAAPSIMDNQSTYFGGSMMESSSIGSTADMLDGRMGFGESVQDSASNFIRRFIERVCSEAGVTEQHLRNLTENIPMLVGMHIESLEEVYRETKDTPTYKAKITKPNLLPGENFCQIEGMRCFLIADGRELGIREENKTRLSVNETFDDERELNIGAMNGGPCLLPAEGALFLTNYRVIFKGTPLDQFASEMTVTRAFPIGSLIKEKKVTKAVNIQMSHQIQTCDMYLQIRSSTMQLMKLAFDEEVIPETIENFRMLLRRSRWPLSVYNTFAFNYEAPPVLHRTYSQRQRALRRTHKSINAHLKKKGVDSVKGRSASDDLEAEEMQQVLFEQENRGADRLKESPICKDYERLGLCEITKISASPWRISMANFHYNVCRSYPAVVVIPSKVSDDSLIKVAKNHRLNRFPTAVWRHKRTKGTLLRSGALNRSVLTAVLRTGLGGRQTMGNHSANITDDEQFFTEIVNASHLYQHKGQTQTVSSGAALSLQAMSDDFASMFEGSDAFQRSAAEISEIKNWEPANLYIFTRGTPKVNKMESSQKIVVVNVDIHDVNQVKASFSKLSKVCCPSSISNESHFLSSFEESKWLSQVSSVLQLSCAIANLIVIQGSSCLVSLGDGSEVTSQVISLVQILSDPYYRTIAGFKVLIEKDWLAFGYRFSYRGNHTQPPQQAIAPFFFQFLDCVHQIIEQYPHAFEFNNYFIKLIAYHQTSMRFNTFFLDSEHERYQNGWFPDSEKVNPMTVKSDTSVKGKTNLVRNKKEANLRAEQLAQQQAEQKQKKSSSVSLWDYLDIQGNKYTLFQSFLYHPHLHKGILQPFCNISNLEVWDYLTVENLFTGPTYDVEMMADFEMANPGTESSASADIDREDLQRCVTGCYGSTQEFPRDEVTYLLSELVRLRDEMDQSNRQWTDTWSDLDVKSVVKRQSKAMKWSSYWAKERRLALHKRATIDIVMKGKITELGQVRAEFGFEYPHTFVLKNYLKGSICNYCLQQIQGLNAGYQCSQCGYNVHTKCQSMVPAECPKHPNLSEQQTTELSRSVHSLQGGDSGRNPRNFKGTLYKRGHLLKQWKPRWFVLDAERNHLTYYDSEADTQLQGYIDLGELRTCRLMQVPPGAAKVGDARSYFELETTKRVYQLLAPNGDTAKEWVERLNALNV